MAESQRELNLRNFNAPPMIDRGNGRASQLTKDTPLHQEAVKRMDRERDLKIIITATDSQTGVGKTTLATWFAINWTYMFADRGWDPEEYATVDPKEYFKMIYEVPRGTVLLIDDAEELDARRSMADLNVKFSWRWQLMRYKQLITIITLPSPASIDSRIEALADVWINVLSRGHAMAHAIGVADYGARNVTTKKVHRVEWPNIDQREEMEELREYKDEKVERWDKEARGEGEGSEELDKVQQTFLAIAKKEQHDAAWTDVPDLDERLSYSYEFYRKRAKELMEE